MTEIFIVETRSLRPSGPNISYLACEPVFFASTITRAETWMNDQNPGSYERYYYCVFKTVLDSDRDFELIGYYDMLGQKSTMDRCIEIVYPKIDAPTLTQ
jgi:hypothetical protein